MDRVARAWIVSATFVCTMTKLSVSTIQSSDNANRPTAAPKNGLTVTDKTMYFTAPHVLSDPLTTFYTETFTLYSSLQRIVATGMTLPRLDGRLNFDDKGVLMGPDGPFGTPSSETVGHMNRLVGLYLSELTALKNSPDISVGAFILSAHSQTDESSRS